MKWPWEHLFDYMYKRYVELLVENKRIKRQLDSLPIIMGNFEWESKPTQADKISPHSHMTLSELFIRLGKSFPLNNGFRRFKVMNTNSMEPWIDDNSIVIGSNNITKLTRGDVVIYNGKMGSIPVLIVHKIINISQSGKSFYIKGDNNYFADGWVNNDKIEWRVVNVGYAKPQREDD